MTANASYVFQDHRETHPNPGIIPYPPGKYTKAYHNVLREYHARGEEIARLQEQLKKYNNND